MSALLAAGINAVAGLFGGGGNEGPSKSEVKELQEHFLRNNPNDLRKGAKKSGFNPLTLIGGGGLQTSANTSYQGKGSKLGFAGRVAQGLSAGLSAYQGEKDRQVAAEVNAANVALAQAQTEKVKAGGAQQTMMRTRRAASTNVGYPNRRSTVPIPANTPLADGSSPTMEKRADGSLGANRDNPAEMEADAWAHALNGTLQEEANRVWIKNFGKTPFHHAHEAGAAANKWVLGKLANPHPLLPSQREPDGVTVGFPNAL